MFNLITAVRYVVHAHNVAAYPSCASPNLLFNGRVDDRLMIGYREQVRVLHQGVWISATFLCHTADRFTYMVQTDVGVLEVRRIERGPAGAH